jgi:protein-S-isoprenylcysteine O-methyltransferase Ste14
MFEHDCLHIPPHANVVAMDSGLALRAPRNDEGRMTIYRWLIAALWLGLCAYWAISAVGVKRNLDRRASWKEFGLRGLVAALVLLLLAVPPLRHLLRELQADQTRSAALGAIGVILCAAGIGLMVAARIHLGRNWGMPVSRKEDPELVMSGPYARVRHPIYGVIMLAMLGTTIGASVFWAVPLVLFGIYFVFAARREENNMTMQFPEQYPAYMRRTRMLLPLVL